MAKATGIEAMAVGTANGIDFTLDDLKETIRAFKEQKLAGKLPVKIGHHDDSTQPAFGWIVDMRLSGDRLLIDVDDVPEETAQEVREGRWRHVSMELLRNAKRGGRSYKWIPDAVALLGAARPAFDWLKGLADKFAEAAPGFTFERKVCFSMSPTGGNSKAMSEERTVKQLMAELVRVEFEHAITSGRILPREREAFTRRYGDSATIDDAREWISTAPSPNGNRGPQSRYSQERSTGRADAEVVRLAREYQDQRRKDFDEKVDYSAAVKHVLSTNASLADSYKFFADEYYGTGRAVDVD
jgi:hypothetical protein